MNWVEVARKDPEKIFELFRDRYATRPDLSFAAEALGESKHPKAVEELLGLLDRGVASSVIEGIIYGLAHNWHDYRVIEALRNIKAHNANNTLRQLASNELDKIPDGLYNKYL